MSENTTPRRGRRNILIGIGILAGLALVSGLYWLMFLRGYVSTDDARFAANLVDIAPEISGTLDSVFVDEGDAVPAGRILFRLDTATLEAAAAKADAEVTAATAAVAVAEADFLKSVHGPRADEIRQAAAAEAGARSEEQLARTTLDRMERLYAAGGVSEAERDRARTAWESARQTHEERQAQLALLESGTREEDVVAARQKLQMTRAQEDAAAAAARLAHVRLDQAAVVAPFAGVVARRWLDPGAAVSAAQPVLTLLNPATLHVTANVEEKQLTNLEVGDPVAIKVDAFPDLRLRGHVTTIGRATNSEFSLIPSEGVSGTFIKVAQRVPLRIDLDEPPARTVSPGLSVEVKINTRAAAEDRASAGERAKPAGPGAVARD